ncbi:MAG: 4-hydroxy-tetrahydrodipicolinate synthase [Bacteroidota bacterium]
MTKRTSLQGCGTALVTPFTADGRLDEVALARLVEFQIDEGIDFLVPCGTTGESATLSIEEHLRVVEVVLQRAKGQVPVIAGAGGNNTAHVIEMAKRTEGLGVDGLLSVTPYYNKPTRQGLFQHYCALAKAVKLPVILYNVPSRTSANLLPDTVVELSTIDNIIGIKEASGDINQIGELAAKIPVGFKLFSGDDAVTLPIIALGGAGVVSVVSNQAPRMMTGLTHLCLDGKFEQARALHRKLYRLMRLNFIETNPIPVKAGLAMMGFIEESYRLPLVPMGEEHRQMLSSAMKELGLMRDHD